MFVLHEELVLGGADGAAQAPAGLPAETAARCDHSHTHGLRIYPGSVAGVGGFRLGRLGLSSSKTLVPRAIVNGSKYNIQTRLGLQVGSRGISYQKVDVSYHVYYCVYSYVFLMYSLNTTVFQEYSLYSRYIPMYLR